MSGKSLLVSLGLAAALDALLALSRSDAAEYQWAVPIASVTSEETGGPPRAFLWIPPECREVRGLVLAQHNMLEEPVLEHPLFRAALAELGFAEIYVTPPIGAQPKLGAEEGARFETMFRALAEESGYAEIARAPVVVLGHSAMADFPYLFAAWQPGRTLAAVSLKGSWLEKGRPPAPWSGEQVAGVPLLLVNGEYEWAEERAGKALQFRREFPAVPYSMAADAGGGHFDFHDALVRFLADYVRAAAKHRFSANAAQPLRPIDATKEGWLVDRWRMDQSPRAPAAPVGAYTGEVRDTYWCFDEAHAAATEKMQGLYVGKKAQLLGYAQAGKILSQDPKTHQQVTIPFQPEAAGDGLTFQLRGAFLDTVPEGRPARWTGLPAGSPIAHAQGGGPIVIRRICGPVEKLDDATFALRFDRLGFDNRKRGAEIWLLAEHPGDAIFKRAVQQALLRIPLRNQEGTPQTITFPKLPDQRADAAARIALAAQSSAGPEAAVRFHVREGPAEITADGVSLRLTRIPPRAKFPVKVTVVAWQWGRSIEPKLQTAEPVARTFSIQEAHVAAAK